MQTNGRGLNTRILVVMLVFVFLGTLILIRSAYLQLVPNPKLSKLQGKLFARTVILKPRRGTIYDRYGKELTFSVPSLSLVADPQKVREPYYIAKKLSSLLNLSKGKTLKKLLNKKRRFIWIKRHLNPKQEKKIRSWKLSGLYFVKENKRFYPLQNSLYPVLGFVGTEGKGLEGLERQYDHVLKSKSKKVLIERDARGRPLFVDFSSFITKTSGLDVYLTIDSDLQFYVEKQLFQAVINSKAKSAMGLVLSVKTSEVLAMANITGYNYSKRLKISFGRNRVVTDIFEPGSTLKTFTLISALKKGITPSQAFSSRGEDLNLGSLIIKEANRKKKFKPFLNMSEILALSSNVGAANMALYVGDRHLRETLSFFGFGEKTGIDFPGEAKGLLRGLPWKPVETATVGFGHGVASSALQIANAYASIANGGLLNRPFLVRCIKDPYTTKIRNKAVDPCLEKQGIHKIFTSYKIRQVLTPKQARTVSLMLVSATESNATGEKARVSGYFVAGKTGTAQKVDLKKRGYKKGEYISSFAGFIPAHNPKFVIYLVVDGAKDNFYSSSLVAPVFSEVASYLVRRAGLSPTVVARNNVILSHKQASMSGKENRRSKKIFFRSIDSTKTLTMPSLKGLSVREVLKQMQKKQVIKNVKIHGSGILTRSVPVAGKSLTKNQVVHLFFNN